MFAAMGSQKGDDIMKGFIRLEKKYGIKVFKDEIYNPFTGRMKMRYKIYSADGCPWENGLTKAGVKKECEKYGEKLLKIKERM